MKQYIDKDAVVAELNRLIAELVEEGEDTMFEQGRISAFEDVKVFINHTLEVKEVDLPTDVSEDEHWQDVREHAAIAAMQGVMGFFGSIDYNRETIAKLAVEQADALIKQLKER